jgi:4-hydroxybenzoate polyprenyltransferase
MHLAWPYHAGLAVAAVLVAFQYRLIRNRDPQDCFRAFRHNNWVGAVIFAGTFAAFYLQRPL